jgi:hypothetical protein
MNMTETVIGLVAAAITFSVLIVALILGAALKRKKAKKQLQTLLGTVYPSANRKTK